MSIDKYEQVVIAVFNNDELVFNILSFLRMNFIRSSISIEKGIFNHE